MSVSVKASVGKWMVSRTADLLLCSSSLLARILDNDNADTLPSPIVVVTLEDIGCGNGGASTVGGAVSGMVTSAIGSVALLLISDLFSSTVVLAFSLGAMPFSTIE
ncbi:MAG TPA: hypothetical protein VF677_08585 [Flavobacterium sp.]|jgi:hypothetical protein